MRPLGMAAISSLPPARSSTAEAMSISESLAPEQKLFLPENSHQPSKCLTTVRVSSGFRALPQNHCLRAVCSNHGCHWSRRENRRTGRQHRVVKSRTRGRWSFVDPGELAHHREGVVPVGALAAEGLWDCQRQQAAATQGIALGFRRAATLVALDGGLGKLPGQFAGDGQGRAQGGI